MASTSETGHAKNVANFEDMISFCNGYGGSYNPSKIAIQIPSLNTLRTNAENAVADVNAANTAFINATNARQIAFNPVKPLATRLVNALEATDATDELIKDAKTLNRKVQGARKSKGQNPKRHQLHPIHLQKINRFPFHNKAMTALLRMLES